MRFPKEDQQRAKQFRCALEAREPMILHLTFLKQTDRLLPPRLQYQINLRSLAPILLLEQSQRQKSKS